MPAFLDTAVFKKGEERYYPVILYGRTDDLE